MSRGGPINQGQQTIHDAPGNRRPVMQFAPAQEQHDRQERHADYEGSEDARSRRHCELLHGLQFTDKQGQQTNDGGDTGEKTGPDKTPDTTDHRRLIV